MAHTNLAKSKNAFEHILAESILLVALGQTIAFCEAKMFCLKANLLQAKALLPKVNLLLAKALLQKAALLDWCVPGLNRHSHNKITSDIFVIDAINSHGPECVKKDK